MRWRYAAHRLGLFGLRSPSADLLGVPYGWRNLLKPAPTVGKIAGDAYRAAHENGGGASGTTPAPPPT